MSASNKPQTLSGTALVTGGAVRIGRSIVLKLAELGMDVLVHYRHSRSEAERLCDTLRSMGRRGWALEGSLESPAACDELWRMAHESAGAIRVLVNNASVFSREALIEADAADFDRHWRINALAPMWLTRLLAQDVRANVDASTSAGATPVAAVVNLLDRRVAMPESGGLPYLVSKCALHAFTCSAALELAPRIRVNAVAPGAILPPPGQRDIPEPAGRAPLQTRCRPEDVAEAVGFLAGSPCVTGQVIYVDAGQHLWSV